MRITIKKKGKTAILISFDTLKEKFKSPSERNRFYWGLYGRRQIVIKRSKKYVYEREGVLEEIPHIKVSNSVFIVALQHLQKLMEFFKEWEDKIELKTFPVLLNESEIRKLEKLR
jgi:hypothetical protein